MAIRFDAIGDYLERATITPPFSICGWAYMVNDRDDYSTLFAVDQQTVGAGTGRSLSLQTDADGVTLGLWDNAAYVGSRTLTPGQWFFWAVVFSSNTSAVWYHANLGDLTLYVSPTATTSNASNQYHHISNNAYSEWFDGRHAYLKHWSVAKTEAQLTSEMLTIRPQSLSSVYLFTPTFPGSVIRARDYSGNGRNWTEGGTLTDEDPPPISWGAMAYLISKVATGGTGYTQSATGTLTSAGVAVKSTAKSLAGTLTSAGALLRMVAKTFAGTVTTAGGVSKQADKSFTGTLTQAGALLRDTLKSLAGGVSSSGALATVRLYLAVLDGTLASIGVVTKSTDRAFTGALSSVGELVRMALKDMVGSLTSGGALTQVRTFVLALVGTLTSGGSVNRQTGKSLSGTLASGGGSFRQTLKTLAGGVSSSGGLTTLRIYLAVLAGALTSGGGLTRQIGKGLAGTLALSGAILKAVSLFLAGVLSLAGTLVAVSSGVEAFPWTLQARALAWTLQNRLPGWRLKTRPDEWTLQDV